MTSTPVLMSTTECCPRCALRFSARSALIQGGVPMRFNVFSRTDAGVAVRCPGCGHVFDAQALRLFGVMRARHVRWMVLGILLLCVTLVVLQR